MKTNLMILGGGRGRSGLLNLTLSGLAILRARAATLHAASAPRLILFANEASQRSALREADVVYAANEARIEPDKDWVMLAPYGEFRHSQGIQVFQREDGETLANEFNSLLGIPRRVLGLPVYVGHPDHPKFAAKYPETILLGRVKKLEAREAGLFANIRWNEDGKEMLESGKLNRPSVNWGMIKGADGKFRPVRVKSVGMTDEPNLPVPAVSFANEAEIFMEKKKLIELLGLEATATDEQIDASLKGMRTAATELANEKTRATQAEEARTKAETDFANEKTAREKAEAALKVARGKAAGVLIAAGMAAGKIIPAEKAQWETEFANEFEAAATKLESAKQKVKTQFTAKDLGSRNTQSTERADKVQDFVNERMTKHGEDYNTAYKNVKRAKPELFETTGG